MQVKIREKGQMTLPKEIRDKVGVETGESLTVLVIDGEIRMRPAKGVVDRLFGSMTSDLEQSEPKETLEETLAREKQSAAEGWVEREIKWKRNS
jgi:AbrB family looped-hinge helix DNA binding protein